MSNGRLAVEVTDHYVQTDIGVKYMGYHRPYTEHPAFVRVRITDYDNPDATATLTVEEARWLVDTLTKGIERAEEGL